MASRRSSPDPDLCCSVCSDIFRFPVVLRCSHNFCKACLEQCWKDHQSQECPLCRRRSTNDPPINVPLKIRCENYLEETGQRPSIRYGVRKGSVKTLSESEIQRGSQKGFAMPGTQWGSQRDSTASGILGGSQTNSAEFEVPDGSQGATAEIEVICNLHNEKLKLFCLEDRQSICVVCRDSKKHRTHICVPMEEAVQDYKEEIQNILKPLKEKLDLYKKAKFTCAQSLGHITNQVQHTEKRIDQEFEILHKFLQDEKAAKVAALKQEEEQKIQTLNSKIEDMSRNMSLLSDTISATEKELEAGDISFLKNMDTTKERAQCPLPDPQLAKGSLIDVAKHLGNLQFRVWEKMQGMFKYTPVVLDPNTANWCLSLSDDLTCVRRVSVQQNIPDNLERCMRYVDVLGSEAFSSGKHTWDVEVGDYPNWFLGVAKESINRRSELGVTPKDGIWCLMLQNGRYRAGGVEDIPMKRKPQRIRLQLDYDRGEVTFYDPKDMTHIHTHKDRFTERLLPYFNIGKGTEANNSGIKICQSIVSLSI